MKSFLLAALIAVVPASLYAAPAVRVAERDVPQQVYDRDRPGDHASWNHERYTRWNDSHWARDFHGRWRMLGGYLDARTDRQTVNVGGVRLHKLRIEAVKGQPEVDRLTVMFTDGSSQTIELNARLERGGGEVIDLDTTGDRKIRRLVVFTQPTTRGTFSIYAG